MQDLKNQLRHMKGKAVSVNGNVYAIDMAGIAHNVKAEDAEKLLAGKNWETVSAPDESPLLDDAGEPVTAGSCLDESMDIDALKAMADDLGVAYGTNIGKALLIERISEAMAEDSSALLDDGDEDEDEDEE